MMDRRKAKLIALALVLGAALAWLGAPLFAEWAAMAGGLLS